MATVFKRQKPWSERIKAGHAYPVDEALSLVKEFANAKFDETVDVAINLGIDPAKSDQQVRGSTVMPNGTGKKVRVAVFTQGKNADAAREAGADIVGLEDLAEKVKAGQMDFDVVVASPDAMRVVGGLGQILGPRGLMPNPKVGTVTPDVAGAVRNAKAGQVRYRVDKAGIVHQDAALRQASGQAFYNPAKFTLRDQKAALASSNSGQTSRPTSMAFRPTCKTSSRTSSFATRFHASPRPTRLARSSRNSFPRTSTSAPTPS